VKKYIINILIIFIFLYLLINVLINKELVFTSVNTSITIWKDNLVPSLFPMFIISEILINYNLGSYIAIILGKYINKLFKINSDVFLLIILSILSGFPSSAKNIRIMYDKGEITSDEASLLLTFTHFSNPLFIMSSLTNFFSGKYILSVIVLISHYLGNFIILFIVRKKLSNKDKDIVINNNISFSKVLIKAINNGINTLLLILGTITFFLLLSSIISNSFNLNTVNNLILKAVLEVTQALSYLGSLNINDIYMVVLASMFLSFGGLCIHFQVISVINDTDIKYSNFFIARIFHMIISGILAYLIYYLYFSLFT